MKKYTFADVSGFEKPRITRTRRQFGDRVYSYQCAGRASTGFGTTPADAYNAWHRNWRRRYAFYGARQEHTEQVMWLYGLTA